MTLTAPQLTTLRRVYFHGQRGVYGVAKTFGQLRDLGLVEEIRPKRWRVTAEGERFVVAMYEGVKA